MPNLDRVTLCCVATDKPVDGMKSLCRSMNRAKFANVKLITHHGALGLVQPVPGMEMCFCNQFKSVAEYSEFLIRELVNYIDTEFVLLVQPDSWIINGELWTDEFYNWDFLGAPWPINWEGIGTPERQVGNGGFSLRSKRLLRVLADMPLRETHPEDVVICRDNRPALESLGIKFAPVELASRFSYECGQCPEGGSFGFHGVFHFNWVR